VREPTLRSRALAVAIALLLASACSSSRAAEEPTPPPPESSTTTTTAPAPTYRTQTATAQVPELEVFADWPGDPSAAPPPPPPPAVEPAGVRPIPRPGFNSAGARKTASGWVFTNPTFYGNPLTMVVTENRGDWLRVMIPARPNGQQGWVRASDVTLGEHQFHGTLTLSDFTLKVWNGEELIAQTQVVIGRDTSPTPVGRVYIAEKIPQRNAGGAYGPWILATNAYSERLDLFDGGLPVIAFHGTNQPQLIGSKASNGCVRVPNDVIDLLAQVLPPGTPIDITA
jgi:lipoprotein-anchoring transpeptidase ErfK/SrfK